MQEIAVAHWEAVLTAKAFLALSSQSFQFGANTSQL